MRTPFSRAAPTSDPPIGLPKLHPAEHLISALVALPAATVSWAAASTAPTISPQRFFSLAASIIRWALVLMVLQMGRKLQKQGVRLVSERDAAVDASRFTEVAPGVVLHHIFSPPKSVAADSEPLLVHFAHGFGANSLTWEPFFGSLRRAFGQRSPRTALTLSAHDRLGFGLSPRPQEMRLYGQAIGATFALRLVEKLLGVRSPPIRTPDAVRVSKWRPERGVPAARPGLEEDVNRTPLQSDAFSSADDDGRATESEGSDSDISSDAPRSPPPQSPRGSREEYTTARASPVTVPTVEGEGASSVVLVGHSLGGALTARMLTQALESRSGVRPRALVLIAPALIAPAAAASPTDAPPPAPPPPSPAAADTPRLWRALTRAVGSIPSALETLTSALTFTVMRLAVMGIIFSGDFWRKGVGAAYCDPRQLTDSMLLAYRWPAQVRGAAGGVARFCLAQVGAVTSEARTSARRRVLGRPPDVATPPSDAEVIAALRASGVPVLIIHGASDRVVPPSNSRRLLARLGGALGESGRVRLVELADCGHCPQEEMPERVAAVVSEFAAENGVLAAA